MTASDVVQKTKKVLPKGYETRMVIITFFAYGFVMFDRFALANISGFWMPDLGLDEAALGLCMSIFALCWAFFGLFGSRLADSKFSRKGILAIAVLLFSIMSFLTGLAQGLMSLLLIRAVMGCAEGPVMPITQSFVTSQSSKKRMGLNVGIVEIVAVGLLSSLLGPIIQVALAESIGWRATFLVTIVPGLIIAFFCWKFLINPGDALTEDEANELAIADEHHIGDGFDAAPDFDDPKQKGGVLKSLTRKNVLLSMLGNIFLLAWYICMLTYMPSYLTNVGGYSPTDMSFIMSALGVGAIVWGLVVPGLSDRFGRKPIVIISTILAFAGTLLMVLVVNMGINSFPLMLLLAVVAWAGAGTCALVQSIIPAEACDPNFRATTIASIQFVGEIVGGSIGAAILGFVAVAAGTEIVIIVLGICMVILTIICCFYSESAPIVLEKRKAAKAA